MLRAVDSEVRSMLQSSLLEMGVDVVLREKITALEVGPHGECQIELGSGRKLVSERLLVLSGQIGNTVDLGFDEIGVQTDESNHVVVDDDYRTSVEGIYAIGSVIDPLGLGHPVTLQAEVAVASATGEPLDGSPYDPAWALYSATEVAMCGLTQEVCAMLDLETVSTSAGCTDTGRGSSRFAKVVVNASTGRILGAQLAGAGAPEAIGLVSSLIGRDVHIEECARISGPEGTLTGLCSDAIRSALAELRTGRFGSEWRLPRGSDGSGGSNVAVSRSNPHAALRSYSTEVRE
jgi:dihydrolipoamide dehydrogenase